MSAAPASGSAMISAVTLQKGTTDRQNRKSVDQVPEAEQAVDSEENEQYERVFDGVLSSASRLSQVQENKIDDNDLIVGIELMAPTQAYRTSQSKRSGSKVGDVGQPQQNSGRRHRVKAIDINQDEGVQRDELLMLDLVGLGETGGNQQSSSVFDEMDFTRTTAEELLVQVLEQTLKAYSVDEKLASLEVLNMIDEDELEQLKKIMIEPLLKNCPPQLWSSSIIDLGNYPLNPHLNNEIRF